ncbi:MAG: porin, partial [Paraburkholderia sp.]|nr:porin [Paraburkholderia sp.]
MFVKSLSYCSLARRLHGAQTYLAQKVPEKNRGWMSGVLLGLTLLLSCGVAPSVLAQTRATDPAATSDQAPTGNQAQAEGQTSAARQTPPTPTWLWDRSNLLGDMGGLRPWLGNYGVTFNLEETSEYLNNLSGGVKRGGAYDGLTQFGIVVETDKAVGLPGGTFNVSGLQIHGSSLSQRNLQTLQSASGIEADDSTRLWELWYQQSLIGG